MEADLVIPKPFTINIKPSRRDASALAHHAARARLFDDTTGPRNAIETARVLVKLEKHEEALEHLCNYVEKRRILDGWEKDLQDLMLILVEGCVEMQNACKARQALARYRNMCVAGNASVVPVVEHFLEACCMEAERCLPGLKRQGLEFILENSGANFDRLKPQDHRALIEGFRSNSSTSCFAFAWEVHRMLLDVFKNHSDFESAYNITVQRVLNFCLTYWRVDEFHDICNIIRYHLNVLVKDSGHKPNFPALNDVWTAQNYITTRFVQLRVAVELKQWQEAFCTIEDINFLARATQISFSLGMMRKYYAQLSKIFKAVDCDLYHAISLYVSFILEKEGMSNSESKLKASAVLLAALSVPLYDDNGEREYEDTIRKDSILLGACLGASTEMISEGILAYVTPQVRKLFHLLEETDAPECYPANLAAEARALLLNLHLQLGKDYGSKLWKLMALRVLKKVSATYPILKFEDLHSMLPFLTLSEVEHLLIEAAQHGFFDNEVVWCATQGVIQFKGHGLQGYDCALCNSLKCLVKARELIHSMGQPTKIRRVEDFPSYTKNPIDAHDCKMHTGRWRERSSGEYFAEQQEDEDGLTTSTSSTNSSTEAGVDTWYSSCTESPHTIDTWHHRSGKGRRLLDSWGPYSRERQSSDDSWRSRNGQVGSVSSTDAETVETATLTDCPRGKAARADDVERDLCFHSSWHKCKVR